VTNTTYASVSELRAQYGSIDAKYDEEIQRALNAAAELVDELNGYEVPMEAPATATVRQFGGSGSVVQAIRPCVAITLVEYKRSASDTTWVSLASTDWIGFQGDPLYPVFDTAPYHGLMLLPGAAIKVFPSGRMENGASRAKLNPSAPAAITLPTVRVTGRFGMAAVLPERAKTAVLTQASRWVARASMKWADTTVTGDMGQLQYRKVLDPDVMAMLSEGGLMKPTTG